MLKISWNSLVIVFAAIGGVAAAEPEASVPEASIFENPGPAAPAGELDRIVFAKLASLDMQPVLCSDAVFVRRAYLDVIGTLPTAEEVKAFLDDPDAANKRHVLIDRLLERSEYADYWSMKWGTHQDYPGRSGGQPRSDARGDYGLWSDRPSASGTLRLVLGLGRVPG